jgi:hypothetical protein
VIVFDPAAVEHPFIDFCVAERSARPDSAQVAQDIINDYKINSKKSLSHVMRRLKKHLIPCFRGRRLASITPLTGGATKPYRLTQGKNIEAATEPEVWRPPSNAEINRELAILSVCATSHGMVVLFAPTAASANVKQVLDLPGP